MSTQKELITNALASAITRSAQTVTERFNKLPKEEAFEIQIQAITKALMAVTEMSDMSPVQLATNGGSWFAMGRIHVGGNSAGAMATKAMLGRIHDEVLKHEACDCEHCKASEGEAVQAANTFQSVNQQTAQDILNEIQAETCH